MTKQFMVVSMPKDGSTSIDGFHPLHNSYDDAFEIFNGLVAMESEQLFKQPKGEKPLRVVLKNEVVELWVISRSSENLTNR